MESIKCVCVGDGTVGKTSMVISYTTELFPVDYLPTVFDNYQRNMLVDGRPTIFGIWDTAGQEEYDRLRPLSYIEADVFIVCYSITSPSSLDNAVTKWVPEIRSHCPNAPFVLVGTKCDLRKDTRWQQRLRAKGKVCTFVDPGDAMEKGKQFGAARVLECSAKTQVGLENIFDEVAKVGLVARLRPKTKKRNKCALL